MSYFNMFQKDPVAKSTVQDQALAQQQLRFAPPPPQQASTTDQVKSKAVNMGMDQAGSYLKDQGISGLKDMFGFGAAAPTVGTAAAPAIASPAAGLGSAFVTPGASLGATQAAGATLGSSAATGGAMAGLGTAAAAAAPWLIGGYFGGKALGLFSEGGHVGPLGDPNISKIKYKQSGGKINEEIEVSYAGPLTQKG